MTHSLPKDALNKPVIPNASEESGRWATPRASINAPPAPPDPSLTLGVTLVQSFLVTNAEESFDRPSQPWRCRSQLLICAPQPRMFVLHAPQRASDLLPIADEADFARTRCVEGVAEVSVEGIVAAAVHVFEAARMRVDALRHQRLEFSGRVELRAAGEEDFTHLAAQLRESLAVPLIGESALHRVADRFVVGVDQHAARIHVAVSAHDRGVESGRAAAVFLRE